MRPINRVQPLLKRAVLARHELYAYSLRLARRQGRLPPFGNGLVVTAEEDADATDPEVFWDRCLALWIKWYRTCLIGLIWISRCLCRTIWNLDAG